MTEKKEVKAATKAVKKATTKKSATKATATVVSMKSILTPFFICNTIKK